MGKINIEENNIYMNEIILIEKIVKLMRRSENTSGGGRGF